MRLPNFLVIGAMKAGTTTFYHDLAAHPQIYLAEKEFGALARDVSMAEYAAQFRRAKVNQLCGDVSTVYSMLPDVPGVAERAARYLSPNTKIIYLVREPIARAVSHHFHYYSLGDERQMEADFDGCVRRHAGLANYGKYGEQLNDWIRCWGAAAIRVVRFEDYISDRGATMARVFSFLGLTTKKNVRISCGAKNASAGKPILNDFWRTLTQLKLYRRVMRPCLSLAMRDRLRAALLPTAPPPTAPPHPNTIDQLLSIFIPDGDRLQQLTHSPAPFWDYAAVRAAHVEQWNRWQSSPEHRKTA